MLPTVCFFLIYHVSHRYEKSPEKLQQILSSLPDWVKSPDLEMSEWLNDLMDGLWPKLKVGIADSLHQSLDPIVEGLSPHKMLTLKV